ncbi:MAG TPA: hypothetical protein VF469_22000 [Kofleriaceae bacterium]
MKRIGIATVLALAAPAVAYAQPPVPDREPQPYERDRDRDVYRDRYNHDHDSYRHEHYDRFGHSHWASDLPGRWVTLAHASSASGRREFMVGTTNRYRALRIEGLRGDPAIEKIAINFADGTTQVVQLNATLLAGSGELIDLQGHERTVLRIVVYADPRSRGVYAIYGT